MVTRRQALQQGAAVAGLAGIPGGGLAQDRYDQQHLLSFETVGTVTLMHMGDLFGQVHPHLMRPSSDKRARAGERHLPEYQTGELLRIRFGIGGRQPMDYALTDAHFAQDALVYGPMGGLAHVATVVDAIRRQRPGALLIAGAGAEPLQPENLAQPVEDITVQGVQIALVDVGDVDALPDLVRDAKARGALVVVRSALGVAANRVVAALVPGIDVMLCNGDAPAFPEPVKVGKTYLIASGTQGRFVGRVDLDVQEGRIARMAHRMIPVFSDLIDPAEEISVTPADLSVLGDARTLLYRRGAIRSSWDDLLGAALRYETGADVALLPGMQHGVSVLAEQPIRRADLQSVLWGIPAQASVVEMTGARILGRLVDAGERVFHPDPMLRTATALMRASGLRYGVDPDADPGARITEVTLEDGNAFDLAKTYRVALWGVPMAAQDGLLMEEIVARYLATGYKATPD